MSDFVRLDDLDFGNDEANATAKKWREAIENANRWSVTIGKFRFDGSGTNGYSLAVPEARGARFGVVTTAITTGGTNTAGTGKVMLQKRVGTDLSDDREVDVYTNFVLTASIAVGRKVVVSYEGPDWILVGAQCP
jgi:hypothetical protein